MQFDAAFFQGFDGARLQLGNRLEYSEHIDPAALTLAVPKFSLLLLVENAIKHGVGATSGPVEIVLAARRDGERLHISLENDMPPERSSRQTPAGMGIGLRNVAERLTLRFQGDGRLSSGPIAPGRYRVSIDLPWRQACPD